MKLTPEIVRGLKKIVSSMEASIVDYPQGFTPDISEYNTGIRYINNLIASYKPEHKKNHRFQVIEYSTGFTVTDTKSGASHWLDDGVNHDFGTLEKPLTVGMPGFRKAWELDLNDDLETLEAYFPEQFEKEVRNAQR